MQEAYRQPRSKCSLCCSVSWLGWGVPHPVLTGGLPHPVATGGYPMQSQRGGGVPSSSPDWGGEYPIQSRRGGGVPLGTPHQSDGAPSDAGGNNDNNCYLIWGIVSVCDCDCNVANRRFHWFLCSRLHQAIGKIRVRAHLHPAPAKSLRHRSQIKSSVLVLCCYTEHLWLQLQLILLSLGNRFATHLGAMLQRRRRHVTIAGCKWALTCRSCRRRVNAAVTLVIQRSLKSVELLQNGLQPHSGLTLCFQWD